MISRVLFSTALAAIDPDRFTFLTSSAPEMFSSSLETRQYRGSKQMKPRQRIRDFLAQVSGLFSGNASTTAGDGGDGTRRSGTGDGGKVSLEFGVVVQFDMFG